MEPEIYQQARRRVKEKASFYRHLYAYLIVNGMFFLFFLTRRHFMPFLPVAFFWGIGLLSHYLKVFGFPGSGVLSREWEDKEVQKEVERLENRRPTPRKASSREAEELELKELRKNYDESELV